MSHNYVVLDRLVSNCHVPVSLQRDSHSLAVVAEVAYPVGANDRSAMAANARNMAGVAPNCLGTAVGFALDPSAMRPPSAFNAASHITGPATVGNGNEVVVACNRNRFW